MILHKSFIILYERWRKMHRNTHKSGIKSNESLVFMGVSYLLISLKY